MDEARVIKTRVDCGALMGPIWIMGWLFTIGFTGLAMPKLLWAVVLWPYYLGRALAG